MVEARGGSFRHAPIGDCWHGETIGRLMRSRVRVYNWLSLDRSWLEKKIKIREAVS